MPAKVVILPPNLTTDKKFEGQSIYARDYCYRHRHGRRTTTPTRSYTSLIKKNQKLAGDMNDMQLSDHFTTYPASLSMGYARKPFNETVGNSKSLGRVKQDYTATNGVNLQDTEEAFLESGPDTLQKIEKAWLAELDTNKRQRENIYGLAGKKMSLHPRKAGENTGHLKTKSLPGLDKWLSTANEYEKQVVHNFVSNLSEAYHRPESTRPQSTPAGLYLNGNQLIKPTKSVRINSKLISPRLQGLQTTGLSPCPPKISPVPPKTPSPAPPPRTPSRCNGSSQSCRSNEEECVGNNVSTQLPHPGDGKPSSPLYEPERPASIMSVASVERPATVPVGKEHTCLNCDACKKKALKKMIDELAGTQLASYEDLLRQKALNQNTIASQPYHPNPQLHEPLDDYLHTGCTFQKVSPRQKGFFTIHPDFVSENIVDLKKLRKKHENYFGESKAPPVY